MRLRKHPTLALSGNRLSGRRTFLYATAALLGTAPLRARSQATVPAKIGFLGNANPIPGSSQLESFLRGLREAGQVEGRDFTIEYRWADGSSERLPRLTAELLAAKVDVIVVSGPVAMRAARNLTGTVPIVFVVLTDPVAAGLVQSLARPGGNMTGLASQYDELVTKQMQLLKEALPDLSRLALLRHTTGAPSILAAAESTARSLGLVSRTLEVTTVAELDGAFRMARNERAGAIHVLPSPFLGANRVPLIALAARYRIPAFYELKIYVVDGGLMSYGPNTDDLYGRSASYVDRILKGGDPATMAIERPTRFELVINRKTAAALGLAIAPSLLQRADEVIG